MFYLHFSSCMLVVQLIRVFKMRQKGDDVHTLDNAEALGLAGNCCGLDRSSSSLLQCVCNQHHSLHDNTSDTWWMCCRLQQQEAHQKNKSKDQLTTNSCILSPCHYTQSASLSFQKKVSILFSVLDTVTAVPRKYPGALLSWQWPKSRGT